MKKAVYILVSILIVVLILSLAKNAIVKVSVERGVSLVTGMQLTTRSFRIGIFRTFVDIRGLKLLNPRGYPDRMMMDMPEIYVDYDLPAILDGKIHLYEMRLDLKEFVVVKNEKGELNLNSLNVIKEEEKGGPIEIADIPKMRIDKLRLKIGRVIYKDYSGGRPPAVKEYNIDLDESYTNITDPQVLVSLLVVKALGKTSVAQLTDFDLRSLQDLTFNALSSAQEMTMNAVGLTGKTLETTREATGETVKDTTEALKGATEELKEVFMAPFGQKEEEK
ncbi:MAG: hypothetical protein ACE5JK_04745 [Candidatus Omnitrophota bacterium]